MGRATDLEDVEITDETAPVETVSDDPFMAVDVVTEPGFVFRFRSMADGYSFGDGFLPGEDPDRDNPSRSWVFSLNEVPQHVIDALESSGYEYTGESASPRSLLTEFGEDSEDDTWVDRARRYAVV